MGSGGSGAGHRTGGPGQSTGQSIGLCGSCCEEFGFSLLFSFITIICAE